MNLSWKAKSFITISEIFALKKLFITAYTFFSHDNNSAFFNRNSRHECIPPVEPESKGYVMYASTLAFMIPSAILIYVVVQFTHR